MEPEEGTPLWRLQKLPAERGLQVRRAQGPAARARLLEGLAWRVGLIPLPLGGSRRRPGEGKRTGCDFGCSLAPPHVVFYGEWRVRGLGRLRRAPASSGPSRGFACRRPPGRARTLAGTTYPFPGAAGTK